MKTETCIMRELRRISAALSTEKKLAPIQRHELMAAQQALAWALNLRSGDVLAPMAFVLLGADEQSEELKRLVAGITSDAGLGGAHLALVTSDDDGQHRRL